MTINEIEKNTKERVKSLSIRERKFVKALVAGVDPTNAMRQAGYADSTARVKQGKKLEKVRPAIQELMEKHGITDDLLMEVLAQGLRATKKIYQRKNRRGEHMANIDLIKKQGAKAQGKNEYLHYLETGKKLSPAKAIKANCYMCMNSYSDGRNDCEILDCPLYPFMPYRKDRIKARRVLSEKQQESLQKLVTFRSDARRTASGKQ